jgi:archaellum biogenesis ATPase FlaH
MFFYERIKEEMKLRCNMKNELIEEKIVKNKECMGIVNEEITPKELLMQENSIKVFLQELVLKRNFDTKPQIHEEAQDDPKLDSLMEQLKFWNVMDAVKTLSVQMTRDKETEAENDLQLKEMK